ncbi:caspase-1 [Eurytemora carolleeae]|uniref:caspase-1 n=1 Tax=Eurytemora carolleeae TaxID=1294199 RepID=UPI000C789A5B|nr:caspase-1 [Eurytemora carolleeae]XP_023322076.1 caspase-1 [Eurytemora carolleeae]|eukprot:XP_023322075.1 caspase-1-like [Eurytemora affinis]
MDKNDKLKITQNLIRLVASTKMNPELERRLIEYEIFTENMLSGIKIDSLRTVQNLFLKVQTRGPEAFNGLVRALVDSGNHAAARILDPLVEETDENNGNTENEMIDESEVVVRSEEIYTSFPSINSSYYEPPPIQVESIQPLEVKVIKATQLIKGHNIYPMLSKPRGYALLINNETFENPMLTNRKGSEVDANNLDLLLGELGFKVTWRSNLSYRDMCKQILQFRNKPEHQQADMAIICILSHGQNDVIAGSDGREMKTDWLVEQFSNTNCPGLRGKPKFFILQACRGDSSDPGSVPQRTVAVNRVETDAIPISPQQKDPSIEDILIAFSTLPGYVANRDIYRGTWFIESLVQIFMDRAFTADIRDMLDLVARRLRCYESEIGTKQSFEYRVYHFTKKLYFNPGVQEA